MQASTSESTELERVHREAEELQRERDCLLLEKNVLQETIALISTNFSRRSSSHCTHGESLVWGLSASGSGSVASLTLMSPPPPVLVTTPLSVAESPTAMDAESSAPMVSVAPATTPSVVKSAAKPYVVGVGDVIPRSAPSANVA